ncbi:sodium/potassium-transporting ATPase subunit beta-1-interacting protein 3 [Trichinella spiralis]|uniref:sodium/potassium-transporting ATPase subunit beta-1-interacting protein 3 n=1 Tax=Trichinella spiralis TaxID=6334 RepID=UPI0001EFDDF1|nr:sodium/potassium-transporting ATPase subunit beta-1-interacting protein 3 [Trichinella spiralis]
MQEIYHAVEIKNESTSKIPLLWKYVAYYEKCNQNTISSTYETRSIIQVANVNITYLNKFYFITVIFTRYSQVCAIFFCSGSRWMNQMQANCRKRNLKRRLEHRQKRKYFVAIRPHCREVLQAVREVANMMVYSAGTPKYVRHIVQLLDPEGKLFE